MRIVVCVLPDWRFGSAIQARPGTGEIAGCISRGVSTELMDLPQEEQVRDGKSNNWSRAGQSQAAKGC